MHNYWCLIIIILCNTYVKTFHAILIECHFICLVLIFHWTKIWGQKTRCKFIFVSITEVGLGQLLIYLSGISVVSLHSTTFYTTEVVQIVLGVLMEPYQLVGSAAFCLFQNPLTLLAIRNCFIYLNSHLLCTSTFTRCHSMGEKIEHVNKLYKIRYCKVSNTCKIYCVLSMWAELKNC